MISLCKLHVIIFIVSILYSTTLCISKIKNYDDDILDEDDESDEFDFMNIDVNVMGATIQRECSNIECRKSNNQHGNIPTVYERELITQSPRISSILKEHDKFGSQATKKHFPHETLGYVTPWNAHGFVISLTFRSKFNYLSPVWLQVRDEQKTKKPMIAGLEGINMEWINTLRADGIEGTPRIVPRVVYERNTLSSDDVPTIINALLDLAHEKQFDGYVVEIPIIAGTMDLLLQLAHHFANEDKILILVLAKSLNTGKLSVLPDHLKQLLPIVHRFSVNAYDYQMPGPNAPYYWIESVLSQIENQYSQKFLIGLPFYGYDHTDPIIGKAWIDILQQQEDVNKKLYWDKKAHESYLEYSNTHLDQHRIVYYPTLQFLHDRLQLFEKYGVGVAIWELGQGLDYFYDLL